MTFIKKGKKKRNKELTIKSAARELAKKGFEFRFAIKKIGEPNFSHIPSQNASAKGAYTREYPR